MVQVADQGALVAKINRLPGTRVTYLWMANGGPLLCLLLGGRPLFVPLQLDVPLPDDAQRDHGARN